MFNGASILDPDSEDKHTQRTSGCGDPLYPNHVKEASIVNEVKLLYPTYAV